jgi:hypothetical protein
MSSFTVPPRFCGPPDSGNGGYTCGLLAGEMGGVVECTLRAPVPLDVPLEFERTPEGGALRQGEKIVVAAHPTTITVTPPAPIGMQAAMEAMASSPAMDPRHPFPTCFVCGPRRAIGDGLRIFPAPAAEGVHVAAWVPGAEFGNGEKHLRPEFLWAAMDCPTGFAAGFPTAGKLVTGRLAVQQLKPFTSKQAACSCHGRSAWKGENISALRVFTRTKNCAPLPAQPGSKSAPSIAICPGKTSREMRPGRAALSPQCLCSMPAISPWPWCSADLSSWRSTDQISSGVFSQG